MAASSTSITGTLRPALVHLRQRYRSGHPVTISDLVHTLGPNGTLLLAFVLSLPFLSPVSMGPITTPVSLVLILLGWHVSRGRKDFPVPPKFLALSLPAKAFDVIRWLVLRLARRSRGPETHVRQDASPRAGGFLIIVAAVLLAAPIPLLPLTNTLPALGVALAAAGLIKGRRSLLAGSLVLSVLSVLYFAGLAALVYFVGIEAIEGFRDSIFGGSNEPAVG